MAKLVALVPNAMMVEQAWSAVREMNIDATVLMVHSDTVVAAMQRQREQGAVVAVARGNHANLLQRQTNIPVIEIVLSGQNLALLFSQAKALSGKEKPRLALIGFRNMFGDVNTLAQVLNLSVETIFVDTSDEIGQAVNDAQAIGVDVIIGGEIAMEHAARLGVPHLFLHSTQDSVDTAIAMAKRVLYAIEMEKHKAAEFTSLVNYSFDAVLKLDEKGDVAVANYMAEKVFRRGADALCGKNIRELIDLSAPEHPVNVAMRERGNAFATVVQTPTQALMANVASINVDGETIGFILSLQEFKKIEELEEQVRKERYSKGYVAHQTFEGYHTASPAMRDIKETAIQYARYDLPVLLTGEVGVGKQALAECIHNGSLRRKHPFVTVDCGGLSGEMQLRQFMGCTAEGGFPETKGAFAIAHMGTLLVEHVDRMDEYCQYQLLHVIRNGCVVRPDGRMVLPVDVRVLCTTERDLYQRTREGRFLEPLYCVLTQLELHVPSLRERAEDLPELLDLFMEKYSTLYRKYIRLSEEARELIFRQKWGGNVLQLSLFCEKITLLATEKLIPLAFVKKHLPNSFTDMESLAARPVRTPVIVQSPEEAELIRALEEHRGNRAAVAEELGVSKTTLWRRMKKFGVEQRFQ